MLRVTSIVYAPLAFFSSQPGGQAQPFVVAPFPVSQLGEFFPERQDGVVGGDGINDSFFPVVLLPSW